MIGSLIVVVLTLSHVIVFNDMMDEMAARRNSLSAFEVNNPSEAVGGMLRDVVEAAESSGRSRISVWSVSVGWRDTASTALFLAPGKWTILKRY